MATDKAFKSSPQQREITCHNCEHYYKSILCLILRRYTFMTIHPQLSISSQLFQSSCFSSFVKWLHSYLKMYIYFYSFENFLPIYNTYFSIFSTPQCFHPMSVGMSPAPLLSNFNLSPPYLSSSSSHWVQFGMTCANEYGLFCWVMGNLYPQGEVSFSPSATMKCKYPLNIGWVLRIPSSPYARILTSLILYRSCAGNNGHYEFKDASIKPMARRQFADLLPIFWFF